MANYTNLVEVNAIAASDLSAKQFYLCKQSALDTVDVNGAVTDRTFGVILNKPTLGHATEVAVDGIAPVSADGSGTSIAVGDILASSAGGQAVKCTTSDRLTIGEAMDACTIAGGIIRVRLRIGVPFRTPA